MALSRFVVTAQVTVPAGTPALVTTGPGGGFGCESWAGVSGAYGGPYPQVYRPGDVILADSSAGSTGPQLLYQAIGSGNLRAFVQGQDDVGHGGLSN